MTEATGGLKKHCIDPIVWQTRMLAWLSEQL